MKHTDQLYVWDPLVRIFHGLLLLGFAIAYLVEDTRLQLHLLAGSVVLGLILFRLVWGVIGTAHARFADFSISTTQLIGHLKALVRLRSTQHKGHTPIGSMMIFVLLAGLLLLTSSGVLLYALENSHAPFASFAAGLSLRTMILTEQVHGWMADALVLLVLIHVVGVVVESLLQKQNLIRAMVTGYKRVNKESE